MADQSSSLTTSLPRTPRHGGSATCRESVISPRFEITIDAHSDPVRVRLVGTLDLASSGQLEALVSQLCHDRRPRITIDVGGVSVVHCLAIPALARAEQCAREAGGLLVLTDPTALARRIQTLLHPTQPPARARAARAGRDGIIASLVAQSGPATDHTPARPTGVRPQPSGRFTTRAPARE